MKIWTSEHTFDHPWETVAQAAWRKYPNPMVPSVIGADVIDREVVNGVLRTHRLVVSTQWGFPKWTQALIGYANLCYASERSEVDPVNKQMILRTHNVSICSSFKNGLRNRYTFLCIVQLYCTIYERFLDHEVI
ncbi:Protein slowmo [Trachymyrmex septentrionalis]|uniref:Protein slowmo n=1 Tax=Trachymyrmex septentrionalis TaxID=34720 RepID=A0A195F7F8_9HYME|nr:Protein slowmo [Trachymyrmex septentrionalis]